MRLRSKLIVFQASVLVATAILIGAWLMLFIARSVPLMERGVRSRVLACLEDMRVAAELGLAAGDREHLARTLRRCDDEMEEGGFAAAVDPRGQILASRGPVPELGTRPAGDKAVWRTETGFRARIAVMFEGRPLGALWAELSTGHIRRWRQWVLALSSVTLFLVLVSGLASIVFALHLIEPLRRMIHHVHGVARGQLEQAPLPRGSDELGQLAGDLETMTKALRASQEQLSGASRRMGMAQVATNILHNVGNVLNSVNVSSEMLATQLGREQHEVSLERLAKLLSEHRDDPVAFVRDDPRAEKIPDYLRTVAKAIAEERRSGLAEAEELRRNVAHIKAIITTQQRYAADGGVWEDLDLREVISAAVQIQSSAYARHDVKLELHLADVPTVRTDRHRVLQIMTNLLSNARHAVSGYTERRVYVHLNADGDGAQIRVEDSGMGIAGGDLVRIFRHGFSTRSEGHGFGLHASANAARELGGELRAESEGPGKGARFTLRLPPVAPGGAEEAHDAD